MASKRGTYWMSRENFAVYLLPPAKAAKVTGRSLAAVYKRRQKMRKIPDARNASVRRRMQWAVKHWKRLIADFNAGKSYTFSRKFWYEY